MDVQKLLNDYSQAYLDLYRKKPSELRDLGEGWVLVNGARMTATELEELTNQLRKEIDKARAAKRSIVKRLLKWFSTPQPNA